MPPGRFLFDHYFGHNGSLNLFAAMAGFALNFAVIYGDFRYFMRRSSSNPVAPTSTLRMHEPMVPRGVLFWVMMEI